MSKIYNKRNDPKDGSLSLQGSMETLRVVDKFGPIAQQTVAKKLNITVPAAFFHCQKLQNERLLKTIKSDHSNSCKGRPSALWDLDRTTNFTIGLTFVPPLLLIGLADFDGKILIQHQYDLSDINSQEELLNFIESFILAAKEIAHRTSGFIRSVFAGLPGYLDQSSGVVSFSANMPLLIGLNIEKYMYERHGFFCRTLSHYYSTYFGEKCYFPRDITLSIIDWELGLGHVAGYNNEIYNITGKNNTLPKGIRDIAHMRVVKNGQKCRCGKSGCLEAYTGGWAILKKLNRPGIKHLSDIITLAHHHDQQVLDELNQAAKFLGTQMTWIIRLLGIDRIVFTGPLSEIFPLARDAFCEGLKQDLTDEEIKAINPVASLNPLGRLLNGACSLGKHIFLHPEAYPRQLLTATNTSDATYVFNSQIGKSLV